MKVRIKTRAFDAQVNINTAAIKVYVGTILVLGILAVFSGDRPSLGIFCHLGFILVSIAGLVGVFVPMEVQNIDEKESTETVKAKKHKSKPKDTEETKEQVIKNKVPIPTQAETPAPTPAPTAPTPPSTKSQMDDAIIVEETTTPIEPTMSPTDNDEDWDTLFNESFATMQDEAPMDDADDMQCVEEIDALIEQLKKGESEGI